MEGILIFCPKCGKENPDGVVRCENCFEALPPPQPQQQSYTPPQQQSYTPPQQQSYTPPQDATQQPYAPNQAYGNPYGQGGMPPCPKDYLVLNIIFGILSLCSCVGIIPAIIGIVYSAQVKSKYRVGDYAGALAASKTARILFIINMVLGILSVVGNIIYMLFMMVGGGVYWLEEMLSEMYYYYMAVL